MDQSLFVNGIAPIAEGNASLEWFVPALISILMLLAGLLSITVENSFAPVAEGQSTIYLAMMR